MAPSDEAQGRVIQVGGQTIVLQPKPKKGIAALIDGILQKLTPKSGGAQPGPQPAARFQSRVQQQQKEMKEESIPGIVAAAGAMQPQEQKKKMPFDISGMFKPKPKAEGPAAGGWSPSLPNIEMPTAIQMPKFEPLKRMQIGHAQRAAGMPHGNGGNPIDEYVEKVAAKQKNLEAQLKEQKIASTPQQFVKRMLISAAMVSGVIGIAAAWMFVKMGLPAIEGILVGFVLGYGIFKQAFAAFLKFPANKKAGGAKNIERDILFASRDMIISLRSGMPLFNALTSVSTGYGDSSKEFSKIVDRVQLGMPLEEAIDAVIADTKSPSFRKIMLQASVSIKAGADVTAALEAVIEQLSHERVIELRAYGQKLNALAMFYMLFGVIMPSMGIAVITILTTFIAIISVDQGTLEIVLVGIVFMQLVFLKMITASRPVFAM